MNEKDDERTPKKERQSTSRLFDELKRKMDHQENIIQRLSSDNSRLQKENTKLRNDLENAKKKVKIYNWKYINKKKHI